MSDITAREMIKKMRQESPHLTYWDFPKNWRGELTIEKVVLEKNVVVHGGRKYPEVLFLKFKGSEKMLFMSVGKLKKMERLFGDIPKNWEGKTIRLYADPEVKLKGEKVGGLVIEGKK